VIIDIIAVDKYQALSWDPTMGLILFPAKENTVSAEKLNACTALDISNIWPLGSADCVRNI
jgi:hypothetical protein